MKRFTDFLKSKGFYIALGTGVLAFAGLLAMYNYDSTKKEMLEEPAIDLNQPAQLDDEPDVDTPELKAEVEVDETSPVGSDSAIADEEKNDPSEEAADGEAEQETIATETDAEVISNAVDTAPKSAAEAGFAYDGAQSLVWPLAGNIILPYSMDTTVYFATLQAYKCNPGMLIAGEEGATVFAAYEGVVSSVQDTKEYGTVVTVDMGNGYEAKYGQLANVRVSQGDTVTTGQSIADVGPVSSYYSVEGTHLFFEILKDGAPVNPLTLIQ